MFINRFKGILEQWFIHIFCCTQKKYSLLPFMNTIITSITWAVSPEIFSIGSISIRWYGLLFASGFYIGYLIMKRIYKQEGKAIDQIDNLAMYMIIGSLIGARFGHCLFYEPEYYLSHPWDIIKPWTGELGKDAKLGIQGLASHGGAIGILISLIIYTIKTKTSYLWLHDRMMIVTALGATFIRLGNLMNHEIVGIPTDLPWGFVFTRLGDGIARHPAQLYESLSYLCIFITLLLIYKKYKGKVPKGMLYGLFLTLTFTLRFFIEFIKEDQVAFEETMTLNMGQWLSIPFVIFGLSLFVWAIVTPETKKVKL